MPATTTPRPSVHDPLTKSYAIDQITDVEHLRTVTHRMWEAFFSAHAQAAHAIAVLKGYEECRPCMEALSGGQCYQGCEKWQAWQRKVIDGFGSV